MVEALRAMMLVRVLRLPNFVFLILFLMVLRVLILGPDVAVASICWVRVTVLFSPWVIVIVMNAALAFMEVGMLWPMLFFRKKIEKTGVGSCSKECCDREQRSHYTYLLSLNWLNIQPVRLK